MSREIPDSTTACEISVALLMDGIEICADGRAVLWALWYRAGDLPLSVAARRGVFRHLVMEKRCKRLEIYGSAAQIREIVCFGNYAPDIADFEAMAERKVRPVDELLVMAEQQNGGLTWENLANPRGTSLSTEIRLRIVGVENEIARPFEAWPDQIEWQLDASWPA